MRYTYSAPWPTFALSAYLAVSTAHLTGSGPVHLTSEWL